MGRHIAEGVLKAGQVVTWLTAAAGGNLRLITTPRGAE